MSVLVKDCPCKQPDSAFQELGPLAGPSQKSRACSSLASWDLLGPVEVLLGPVFRFWKLLQESSCIRFTSFCFSKAAPVLLSGDAGVNTGKSWMGRGLLTLPQCQARLVQPQCPLPLSASGSAAEALLVPSRKPFLHLWLISMAERIPALLGF